ncbi:FAD-dependent oxidoreductase [Thauera sp. CAU 1555]|uniref:FAD-dependent oxidoreductase n=1 Tax=Thauera sedimentorum TaxID=2767595 RepID=A0ABR9B8C8_9RHOO|nr:FAD-dependent oxidoreductase [Thauera sedimentorum]MBC9071255.1 FAD-dependent oxidoreductase [Thauera sedimentorum]MBD8502174.1 FAD-dependent oxidoreductase [Thauera sedimentorum]
MHSKRLLILAVLLAAIALFFALDLGQYLTLEAFKTRQAEIEAWRAANPWLAAGVFFAVYVAVTALSLPGAAVMTLAVGAVFGLLWGTLLVSFASTIGATLAFLVSRFLLRDWVQARFGERLRAVNAGVERDGAFYLFTLRLVPLFPFFVINLVMGLTPMRARTFYWVSQLGMLAGTVVYVNAGTQLAQIDSPAGILSPGLLGAFVLLGVFPLLARKAVDWVRARRVYAGWLRPSRFERNLVVIGAGSAGLVTAYIAAAVKAKVTLVEKHRMGGDCLNTGCVPSKTLIRSARLVAELRRAGEFGIEAGTPRVDFAAVMERVQRVVRAIEPHDSVERYTGLGVEVLQGEARIVSPWEVEVRDAEGGARRLSTRSIVIATGARPFVPPIPGLAETGYLTSDTVWSLRELPARLLVLGGGPIGCELAQAFARLGSQVAQVEMLPRLMAREDEEVSALVEEGFRAEGIALYLQHEAVRVVADAQGKRMVVRDLSRDGAEAEIAFDAVLVAVGRAANLKGYGLEELGIPAGRTVEVNEFLQTRYPNIYAAGDVAGPYQFTHTAAHQAWYAAVNALFDPLKKFRADYSVIPWATFTDPEVARVGLNEQDAKAAGVKYEVTRYGIDDLDRAIAEGAAEGFVKVLTEPGRDRILGATIVGAHAGELIAEFVLAMRHRIGLNKLLGTIHIYPTMAEANKYAAGAWKRAHAPQRLLAWVARFHAWRRGSA